MNETKRRLPKVIIGFNEDNGPEWRADEHPSVQMYADTIANVPSVGDYVGMKVWNQERKEWSSRLVQVTARRITFHPDPEDRYEDETEMTYFVTLMVKKPEVTPDFRG